MELLEPMVADNSITRYIETLITSVTNAYKTGKSKEVGFPQEYPPKDLYKYFYKYPTRLPYDLLISILQILAVVVPNEVVSCVLPRSPGEIIEILSDVFMEETTFVNLATKCGF